MQEQSTEHALLTNENIFVSPRSRHGWLKGNLEKQTATATAYEVYLRKDVHTAEEFKRLRWDQGVEVSVMMETTQCHFTIPPAAFYVFPS